MDVLQLLNLTERNSLFQGRKKNTDNSFRKPNFDLKVERGSRGVRDLGV